MKRKIIFINLFIMFLFFLISCQIPTEPKKDDKKSDDSSNNENVLKAPVFSHKGGLYFDEITVSITSESGTLIYFTLNGNNPDTTSTQYTIPIIISNNTILKAIAVDDKNKKSSIAIANYTFDMPIVSLPSGYYNIDKIVTVTGNINSKIYYTSTDDGSIPQDPTISDNLYTDNIQLIANYNEEKTYNYKFKSFLISDNTKGSSVISRNWVIDKIVPEPPVIIGISSGTYNTVQKFIISGEDNATISYSLNNGQNWYDYTSEVSLWNIYNQSLIIVAKQTDLAGNVSPTTNPINVIIDRIAPNRVPLFTRNFSNYVKIYWETIPEEDFNRLEIYRKTGSFNTDGTVNGMDLIYSTSDENVLSYNDYDVTSGLKYYYVSVVYDNVGNNLTSQISYSYFPYLDMRNQTFSELTDCGLVEYNNNIYIIGGFSCIDTVLFRMLKYNPDTEDVVFDSFLKTVRFISPKIVNNRIFLFGGEKGDSGFNVFLIRRDEVQSYDFNTNTWDFGTSLSVKTLGIVTEVYNNEIYLIGGNTEDGNINTNQKYTITSGANGVYTLLTPKPNLFTTWGSAILNDNIYVFSATSSQTIVDIYNITTDSWSCGTTLNVSREDFAYCVVDNKLYLIGGFENEESTVRIDEYDLINNTWDRKSDLPFPNYGISAINYNNEIYLIGGRDGGLLNKTIRVYKPLLDN